MLKNEQSNNFIKSKQIENQIRKEVAIRSQANLETKLSRYGELNN